MKALYAQLKNVITVKVYDQKETHYNFTYTDEVITKTFYDKWYHMLIFKKTTTSKRYVGYYEDYYNRGFNEYMRIYTAQELRDKDYIVDDTAKIIYDKPYVEFRFSNKDTFTQKFNNIGELEEFLQPLLNKNKELIRIV